MKLKNCLIGFVICLLFLIVSCPGGAEGSSNAEQPSAEGGSKAEQTAPEWAIGDWWTVVTGSEQSELMVNIKKDSFRAGGEYDIYYDKTGTYTDGNNNKVPTVSNYIVKRSDTEFSVEQHDNNFDLIVFYLKKEGNVYKIARSILDKSVENVKETDFKIVERRTTT